LQERFEDRVVLNGHLTERLPNTLNVSFPGHHADQLLAQLSEVAASTGSACYAGQAEMSPVLRAMGVDEQSGLGAIRFSLGNSEFHDAPLVVNTLGVRNRWQSEPLCNCMANPVWLPLY
jgi:cysteine desulfurase